MNRRNEVRSVRISLPYAPVSGNQYSAMHHHVKKNYKEKWRTMIFVSLSSRIDREWLLAMAKLGKRMKVEIAVTHPRLFDKDNLYQGVKPLVDCLRAYKFNPKQPENFMGLGYLAGDSEKEIDLIVTQQKGKAPQTVFMIEEVASHL